MSMADTHRPEEGGEPEDFGDREPFSDDDGPEADDDRDPFASDERDQLELVDDDVSLPWLEGDDDFEEQGGGGGQIILLAVLALGALALIIGGIWWFTRDRGDGELIADGSVIEAPDQPYKERPEDPGGMKFEGTGDTSYAVSEGETRQVRLGDDSEAPKPGFESVAKSSPSPKPLNSPAAGKTSAPAPEPTQAAAPAGPGVQVGAFSSRSSAEAAWGRLTGSYSALSGLKYRVVEGRADIGTVYRLQALPGDAAAARALCGKLKASGLDCTVKN